MKMHRTFLAIAALLFVAAFISAVAQPPAPQTSTPVYVPNTTHQNDPMPPGVLEWDSTQKSLEVTNGLDFARFVFAFTNVATEASMAQQTNFSYATNFTVVTNRGFWSVFSGHKYSTVVNGIVSNASITTVTNSITPVPVTILNVHPSCGCTTAELPPTPWMLPPGTNSTMKVSVNLAGKSGMIFKSVNVTTDKGKVDLMLRINILPAPPAPPMSEEERARGVAAAKVDRQAVFKGDCVSCHAKNVEGKYDQALFAQVCAICHEANPRATMVPDLHNLKNPTSEEFWRTWVTSGKAGSLMPAFATSQGGPLSDMQIASLARYLNKAFPSHAPPPLNLNVPAVIEK
jgi:mono/diheme cytochrome c family protein